ncbi:MAG TPA: hypothetical protein PLK81_05120 [Kiritimatiellia bacterium]|nr:hypothetical protein [Kiritimatiellia bacterium]
MDNFTRRFPQYGKKFSTVWKKRVWIFHGMEKVIAFFPRHGKKFSTLWKIRKGWRGEATRLSGTALTPSDRSVRMVV